MPWWQQAANCLAVSVLAFNAMYWSMWRHYLPGGKYDHS